MEGSTMIGKSGSVQARFRKIREDKRMKALVFVAVILLLMAPKIVTFMNQANDAFVYSSIAIAQASCEQNRLIIGPFKLPPSLPGATGPPAGSPFSWQSHADGISERVLVTSFLVTFSRVTGLTLREMLFLPVGGIVIVLLAYALGKALSKSSIVALFYALFVSYALNNTNSISYVPLGFATHYLFLIVLIKVMDFRTDIRKSIVMLSIIFFVSNLTYYSAEAFNMFAIASISLLVILAGKKAFRIRFKQHWLPSFALLSLAFLIIFVAFEREVPIYLERASFSRFLDTLAEYITYVFNVFSRNVGQIQQFRSAAANVVSIYLDAVTKVLIVIATATYALTYAMSSLRKSKFIELEVEFAVFISLVIISILELAIYWSYGPAGGFRYVYWFISLLAFYSLSKLGTKLRRKRIFAIISLALVLTVIVRFAIMWQDPVDSHDGRQLYIQMTSSSTWVIQNVDHGRLLSDLHISARLFAEAAFYSKADRIYPYEFYNDIDMLYEFNQTRVESIFNKRGYEYLVLSSSFRSKAVMGDVWAGSGPPLGGALSYFDNYTSFNKIYDDSRGLVYQFQIAGS